MFTPSDVLCRLRCLCATLLVCAPIVGFANAPTVTVVAASATHPAGEERGGFTSMTDDPLGPFAGQSVMFRGTGNGGLPQLYRYQIDFDQDVALDSIVVEGAAWGGGDSISLFDGQGIEIKTINVSNGGNSFHRQVLTLSGVVGRTFFLEEINTDSDWRYRSNIEVNLGGSAAANTIEVSVRALIDGISQIKIQDNQLWWHHIQAAAPGRHRDLDEPTNVNGFDWLPVWPFNDDGRDCDCESDRLDLSNAGIQLTNDLELRAFRVVNARDSAALIQSPSAGNGFLSIIELDDPSSGSAWYEVVAVYGSKSLITIPGTANPWLAGVPDGSTAAGGDVAPDQSPVLAPMTITPGIALSFSATGFANNDSGGGVGPDGKAEYQFHTAENGIADGNMPLSALAGVFLDQSQPDQSALPPILDFGAGGNVPDGTNYTNLSPQLKQVFFVGDGQTDGGVAQQVIPPAGATRVFLGIMDGSQYNNNSGEFEVEISDGTLPVNNVPTAVDDNVNADTGVSVVIDVLNNDQQLADTPIVVSVSADPTNGAAIAGADNDVTYTSTPGFVGDDNFQYIATDRDGDASRATVTVTVVDPNANVLPIANDDSASVRVDIQLGGNVVINVLANDQGLDDEPITVDIYSSPATGTIVVLADYRISYTTFDASTNEDTFEYRVTDANGDWATAKVTVSIQASTVDDGSSNNSNKKKGGGAINPLFLLALFLAILRSNALQSPARSHSHAVQARQRPPDQRSIK
jgi:hypothetical protein